MDVNARAVLKSSEWCENSSAEVTKGHGEEVRSVLKRGGAQGCATKRIRLSKSTVLPAMSNTSVMVTKIASGIIVVYHSHYVTERYKNWRRQWGGRSSTQ